MEMVSSSPRVTQELAKFLAKEVLKDKPKTRHALVFALTGDLGSGKTTFIQGLAKGFGVKNRLVSPTFLIIRNYAIRNKKYKKLFHVDAYRIRKPSEMNVIGFKEDVTDPKNIVVIEWAEKIKRILPKDSVWIRFQHHKENERVIEIASRK